MSLSRTSPRTSCPGKEAAPNPSQKKSPKLQETLRAWLEIKPAEVAAEVPRRKMVGSSHKSRLVTAAATISKHGGSGKQPPDRFGLDFCAWIVFGCWRLTPGAFTKLTETARDKTAAYYSWHPCR